MTTSAMFLHAPAPELDLIPDSQNLQEIQEAEQLIKDLFQPGQRDKMQRSCISFETSCSAAIESETSRARVYRQRKAFNTFIHQPLNQQSLLEMHLQMMATQPHAQPGKYRTIQVRVGNHWPPHSSLVPAMMQELFDYLKQPEDHPLVKAAWAHRQFETIHPFADGNGRTGRALINRVIQAPLPISSYILRERETYYRMLNSANWPEYLDWFVNGALEQARRIARDQLNQPFNRTH